MANNSIDLVSLDFFALKNSFRNYLRDNPSFKDYDYEGSNINVLLDLLSYNTYKNSFYVNMLMSEAFLDSAQLRASVLSHAKELNYTPRSARSARSRIRVNFEAEGTSGPYVIQKGSPFTSLVKNSAYVFTIPETIIVSSTNTSFTFQTDIYEGVYVSDSYVYQSGIENQRFKITNRNVDTRSLTVIVNEDNNEIGDTYILSTTLLDLDADSKVYFLQTSETGGYEVLFGDNNIGKQPKVGAVITIEYRTSNGSAPNGAREFSFDFDPTTAGGSNSSELISTPTITVIENSKDGAEEESLESIRYYAPRHFQAQERTITSTDYTVALKAAFPEINAVYAYGGEDVIPPQYGKVFVAVDISNVDGFPDSKKREYYNFIKRKCPFSIEPIFVEPDFLYIAVDSTVRYNINRTDISRETLKTLVTTAIVDFNDNNLDDFDSILRYSKLSSEIDVSHPSIISSFTDIKIYKKVSPELGRPQSFVVDFGVPLIDNVPEKENRHKATDVNAVTSSIFFVNGIQCVLEDDGSGKIRLMRTDVDFNQKIFDVGTVNYSTGVVTISELTIDSFAGNALKIYGTPNDLDVRSSRNTILTIEGDEIVVNVEQLRE